MSISGPSPLGTLMVQRVEGALGVSTAQQSNIATGARPDAVTQPGQPDKTDPVKNPPPKEQEGSRQAQGRQLAALARNDPEILKLLAARNAPQTAYTASAPTTLGQAAKTILALLQQFPDAKPAVNGRAPLLSQGPGQGTAAGAGQAMGAGGGAATAPPVGGNLDPRAVEALMQRAGGQAQAGGAAANSAAAARAAAGTPQQGANLPASGGAPGQAAGAPGLATGTLFPAPTGMAGQLAMALSQAMQGSGLFYESHLREFTFGQRSLAQVQSEPQAQAGREAANQTQNTAAQARGAGEAPGSQAASSNQGNQAAHAQAGSTAAQASAQLAGALLSMDPSTHMLVRQQLETLANQSFAWQGEAWPGGDMEWEVQRREPEGGTEETESWSTRLKLNLPGLGEVQARLSLSSTQLVMHLAAPEAADIISDHTGLLRERLGVHGLQLSQLTISRETEATTGAQT